jgi:hypothetical protein
VVVKKEKCKGKWMSRNPSSKRWQNQNIDFEGWIVDFRTIDG